MRYPPSTKDYIKDLVKLSNYAKRFLSEEKEYRQLLEALINWRGDQNKFYPSVKDLCKITGLTYAKARKQVHLLFSDIIESLDKEPMNFPRVKYYFSLERGDRFLVYSVENLAVVPRPGERVYVDFFSGYIGIGHFFVHDVSHSFKGDCHEVTIRLVVKMYNQYWNLRKEQAFATGEISHEDYWMGDDHIKEKLKEYPM